MRDEWCIRRNDVSGHSAKTRTALSRILVTYIHRCHCTAKDLSAGMCFRRALRVEVNLPASYAQYAAILKVGHKAEKPWMPSLRNCSSGELWPASYSSQPIPHSPAKALLGSLGQPSQLSGTPSISESTPVQEGADCCDPEPAQHVVVLHDGNAVPGPQGSGPKSDVFLDEGGWASV